MATLPAVVAVNAAVLAAPATIRSFARHKHRRAVPAPPVCPPECAGRADGQARFQKVRVAAASLRRALPPHQAVAPDPSPAEPHKGIAIALAVLFGIFGAHLFYLGLRRQAFQYLVVTLLCALLIVVLVSMLPTATLGNGLIILFLACLALIGIGTVYIRALLDAFRVIFGGTDAVL